MCKQIYGIFMILKFHRYKWLGGKNALESSLAGNNEKKKKGWETLYFTCILLRPLWTFPLECYLKTSNYACSELKWLSSTRVCSSSFPVSVSGITRVSVPPLSCRLHSRSISSAQAVTFPCLDHLLQLFKLPFLLLLSTAHLLSTSPYRALSETYACSSLICLKTPNS